MQTDFLLFLTGIVIGLMNAIAGGGGLVGFPVLLAAGLPAISADATGFVASLPGQISSAIGYRRYLRRVPKLYMLLLIPCVIGSAIGAYLLRQTSSTDFASIVPFLVLLAVLVFAMQPTLNRHLIHHLRTRRKNLWKLLLIGVALFAMTIYGGYFSAGLGFAILALIGFTSIHEVHTMNGIKNVMAVVILTTTIVSVWSADIIHWHYGLVMAAGSLLGGYAGSRFAMAMPSKLVRTGVVVIGLVTAGYLLAWYR